MMLFQLWKQDLCHEQIMSDALILRNRELPLRPRLGMK